MFRALISEFVLDWRLSGKALQTAVSYSKFLLSLAEFDSDPDLVSVKEWISKSESVSVRRKRGQSVRAFGAWADTNGYEVFSWWKQVHLAREAERPQDTAIESNYLEALRKVSSLRDRAVIEVLWSCGLRRSELTKLNAEDVNFAEGFLVVRTSKTGRPRVAPLSPAARHALRKHLGRRIEGSVFEMTPNAVRLLLQRLGAPSAHAWRRGWAVQALRNGVSETSVRAAAGWSSGAMVARYTRALSGELAVEEFQRSWENCREKVV